MAEDARERDARGGTFTDLQGDEQGELQHAQHGLQIGGGGRRGQRPPAGQEEPNHVVGGEPQPPEDRPEDGGVPVGVPRRVEQFGARDAIRCRGPIGERVSDHHAGYCESERAQTGHGAMLRRVGQAFLKNSSEMRWVYRSSPDASIKGATCVAWHASAANLRPRSAPSALMYTARSSRGTSSNSMPSTIITVAGS